MILSIDLNNIILFLVIGLAAGFIATSLFGKRGTSLIYNLVLGLAGAFIGAIILPAVGIHPWGLVGTFITATVGAVIIILVSRLFSRSSRSRW